MTIAFRSKISATKNVLSDIVDTFDIPYFGYNGAAYLYQSMSF